MGRITEYTAFAINLPWQTAIQQAVCRGAKKFEHMTAIPIHLCERLKQLGFSRQSQIRLYGSQFELVGDPW